jgi:hypothetical protein
VWLHIAKALSLEGEAREAQLRDTETWLRRRAGLPTPETTPSEPSAVLNDPVSVILGRELPKKRNAAVRAVEAHAARHSDTADALAAAVLRMHVESEGPKRTAPWWITVTTLALASTEGTATRAAIADLGEAFAVTAYGEPIFTEVVAAARAALESGHRITSVRRGASRDEPADRRLWTLRFKAADGAERQLALAPASETAWPEGLVDGLASRLVSLCPMTVLSTSGSGNHDLADACGRIGITAVSGAPAAAVAALAAMAPRAPAAPAPEPAKAAPEGPSPVDRLKELLAAGGTDIEAMAAAMASIRRRRTVQRVIEETTPDLDDALVAASAVAAAAAWPGDRPLPEFTTMLVRAAARGGAACRALLLEGEHANRLGGTGVSMVLDIVTPAINAGWTVDRLLRGATRRERDNPLVAAAEGPLHDLWRAVVFKDDKRGELWALVDLPAEARAAVPQLLLDPRERAVVLPLEPSLLDWYATLEGPEAIGWSGEEAGEAIVAALEAWAPRES